MQTSSWYFLSLERDMVKISFQEVKDLYEASLDVYNVETSYIVSLIYLKALLT